MNSDLYSEGKEDEWTYRVWLRYDKCYSWPPEKKIDLKNIVMKGSVLMPRAVL
jgi:hypothetical protein